MKYFIHGILVWVMLYSLNATASQLTGEILDYGLYVPLQEMKRERNYASPTGYSQRSQRVLLLQPGDVIPAIKGQLFGFRFRISGFDRDDNEAWLRMQVKHPMMIRPNGSRTEGYSQSVALEVINGVAENQSGYKFDKDFEMVPGEWRFQYWLRDDMIFEKVFQVRKASEEDYKNIAAALKSLLAKESEQRPELDANNNPVAGETGLESQAENNPAPANTNQTVTPNTAVVPGGVQAASKPVE